MLVDEHVVGLVGTIPILPMWWDKDDFVVVVVVETSS